MTAAFRVIIVPCFNLHEQCITMMHEFVCSVCWPVGGTLALLPIIRRSLTSIFTFYHTSHFLSSFCSVTLSLLSLPLCLICTNVLSHHCFSSDTHIHQTHTHTSSASTKYFQHSPPSCLVDTHFPAFTPSLFSVPHLYVLSFVFSSHEIQNAHIRNETSCCLTDLISIVLILNSRHLCIAGSYN